MTFKLNGAAKWAGLVIIALGIFAGIIKSHTLNDAKIEANGSKIKTVKEEGCLPARETGTAIEVINTRFNSMEKSQKARFETMEKAQVVRDKGHTAKYDAIMKKLDK